MKALALALLLVCSQAAGFCLPEGSSSLNRKKVLNTLKNRTTEPKLYNVYSIEEMLQSGDFICNNSEGIIVEGYVLSVSKSRPETANCMSETDLDIHIALGPEKNSPKNKSMTVEVTPYYQGGMTFNQLKSLKGKKVMFKGWQFFDTEHTNVFWRSTACEIHPVQEFKVIQ